MGPEEEGALEEFIVRGADDGEPHLAVLPSANGCRGEVGEAGRGVPGRLRKVGVPARVGGLAPYAVPRWTARACRS